MKIMLSASPSSVFSQSLQYQIFKANTCSILILLTAIKLRLPVSESSTRFSKFYDPTDFEHKFYKTKIKKWLPIGFGLHCLSSTVAVFSDSNFSA